VTSIGGGRSGAIATEARRQRGFRVGRLNAIVERHRVKIVASRIVRRRRDQI
jgi:hypothetical protein